MTHFKIPLQVEFVLDTLNQSNEEGWLVGGCIRDTLLGIEPHDYDITTTWTPNKVMDLFDTVIPTGIQHGTVTVVVDKMPIEVTTMRKEGAYKDHRHPESVSYTKDIKEDLSRRDFTINAMAYHPSKGILDPFNGQTDLHNRLIRAVGDPNERFEEDALRMFRAWSFASRFGMIIEPNTETAIRKNAELANTLAVERIVPLIEAILKNRPDYLYDMKPLLKNWIPATQNLNKYDFEKLADVVQRLKNTNTVNLWSVFLYLLYGTNANKALDLIRIFKLPNKTQNNILNILCHAYLVHLSPEPESLYKLRVFHGLSDEQTKMLFDVWHAWIGEDKLWNYYEREKEKHPFSLSELKVNGYDVLRLTDFRGANVKQALLYVLHETILNPDWNNRQSQLELLHKYHITNR